MTDSTEEEETLKSFFIGAGKGTTEAVGNAFNALGVTAQVIFIPLVPAALGMWFDAGKREEAASKLSTQFDSLGKQEATLRTTVTQRTVTDKTEKSGTVTLTPSEEGITHQGIDNISEQGTVKLDGTSARQEVITTTAKSQVSANVPCLHEKYPYARTEGGNLDPAKFRPADLRVAASCIQGKYSAVLKEQDIDLPYTANAYLTQNTAGALWVTTAVGIVGFHAIKGVWHARENFMQKILETQERE